MALWYTSEVMAKIEIAGAPAEDLATLLAIGTFQRFAVDWNPEQFAPTVEQLVQIKERWAPKAEKGYFPGPVARITGFEIKGYDLGLQMQSTSFKEFVGLQTNGDAKRFGLTQLANPLSVSMAVQTADNKWLLAKKMTGDRIGSLDAVGGYLNPQKDRNDPIETAKREYTEEIGSREDSIRAMIPLALQYEFKNLCHPVLSVLVESGLTSKTILESAPKSADGEVQLLVADDPLRVIAEMEIQGTDIEPDGQFTFALAVGYLANPSVFNKPRVVSQLSELTID
jgi:hypothetical protein